MVFWREYRSYERNNFCHICITFVSVFCTFYNTHYRLSCNYLSLLITLCMWCVSIITAVDYMIALIRPVIPPVIYAERNMYMYKLLSYFHLHDNERPRNRYSYQFPRCRKRTGRRETKKLLNSFTSL